MNISIEMRTLWCSIKKIEAPYMFDWENGMSLKLVLHLKQSCPEKLLENLREERYYKKIDGPPRT